MPVVLVERRPNCAKFQLRGMGIPDRREPSRSHPLAKLFNRFQTVLETLLILGVS
jgi:hypothetical protein